MTQWLGDAWARHFSNKSVGRDEYSNCDFTPTATEEEQLKIKTAFKNGATIEAKGRDTLFCEYGWAVTENPKFNFHRNYYRVKEESPKPV